MAPLSLGDLAAVIGVVAVYAFIAYGVFVLVRRGTHRVTPASAPPRDPAQDALRVRLAKGEIDQAEFERLRSVLARD